MGLSEDLKTVGTSIKTGEAKSLKLAGLKNEFIHNGEKVTYEIKIGKFGPYIDSSLKDENGKDIMRSIPPTYFPGTFSDEDAATLLFPQEDAGELLYNRFLLKKGRYGDYFERISDNKTATWPKALKENPSSASENLIDLLFSIPKVLGVDNQNNEVVLKVGLFGFYASYCGKNYKVQDPENVKLEDIISPSLNMLTKGELDGKPIALTNGRYGLYIKYGDENIPLKQSDKADAQSLTLDRIKEIAKEYLASKEKSVEAEKEFLGLDGTKAFLVNGKYGYYLKWGSDNIALKAEDKENPLSLTEERVKELITEYKEKPKTKKKGINYSKRKKA